MASRFGFFIFICGTTLFYFALERIGGQVYGDRTRSGTSSVGELRYSFAASSRRADE